MLDFGKRIAELSDEHCCELAAVLEAIGKAKMVIAALVPEARPVVAAGTAVAHLLGISSPTLEAIGAELAKRKCKCADLKDVTPSTSR